MSEGVSLPPPPPPPLPDQSRSSLETRQDRHILALPRQKLAFKKYTRVTLKEAGHAAPPPETSGGISGAVRGKVSRM